MNCTVYHTVRSISDKKSILKNAPFFCEDINFKERLGSGYYFWETFEKLAKWWGLVHYRHHGKHFTILKTTFDCPKEYILDLVSNTEQLRDIQIIVDALRQKPEFKDSEFSAQFLIHLICKKAKGQFKAIRAYGQDSAKAKEITQYKYFFNPRSYFHGCPEIQICVKDLSVIKRPMEIVYSSEEDIDGIWTV